MKKILILLICIQLISGNTFLAEIGKTVELFEHFQEHQIENPNISWLAFLQLHYLDQNHKKETDEHHHHKRLPFDNVNTSSVLLFCEVILPLSFKKQQIVTFIAQKSIFPSYEKNICSQYLDTIFQPPRFLS